MHTKFFNRKKQSFNEQSTYGANQFISFGNAYRLPLWPCALGLFAII